MRIIEALKFGFENYYNSSGRIPRSTFIFWNIGKFLIHLLLYVLVALPSYMSHACTANHLCHHLETRIVVSIIYLVVFFSPSISMIVKRLHDIGLSCWWILYVTVFSILVLFLPNEFIFIDFVVCLLFGYVLVFMKSKPDNKYGPNPLNNK